MKPIYSACVAVALVLAAPPVPAQAQATPTIRLLERLDDDGDGAVSKKDVAEVRDRLFDRLDLDGDGLVDWNEIDAMRDAIMDRATGAQARLGRMAFRMDADGNGELSPEEFQGRNILFQLADRDDDGLLSDEELLFVRDLIRGHRG